LGDEHDVFPFLPSPALAPALPLLALSWRKAGRLVGVEGI